MVNNKYEKQLCKERLKICIFYIFTTDADYRIDYIGNHANYYKVHPRQLFPVIFPVWKKGPYSITASDMIHKPPFLKIKNPGN